MIVEAEIAPEVDWSALLKPKRPPMYQVVMFNDDYTPMEFVVSVLTEIFHFNYTKAAGVMMTVHEQGQAVCGLYPKDVAETKANEVMVQARSEEHPLLCTVKPEIL